MLHRAYGFPLRFKTETINEEAMFIPFGYDNFTLIKYLSEDAETPW